MIERLVAALEQKLSDLTAEDICDILWLTLQQWQSDRADPTQPASGTKVTDPPIISETSPGKRSAPSPPKPRDLLSPPPRSPGAGVTTKRPPSKRELISTTTVSGAPLALPDSPALRRSLEILNALRPLIRQVSSGDAQYLDVPATVKAIAETDLWLPKLRPMLEPWLDLALVVDATASMVIWQRTILNLRRVLSQSGVFRDVRLWSLEVQEPAQDAENGAMKVPKPESSLYLRPGYGPATANQSPCRPQELLDPRGRRLILVVSDCIAPCWDTQQIRDLLQVWSDHGPMALLQVLPEWLWNRTALLEVPKGQMVSSSPSQPNQTQPNQTLTFVRRGRWQRKPQIGLKVPVVTLEHQVVARWSQMVAGKSSVSAPGLLFSPVQVRELASVKDSGVKSSQASPSEAVSPTQTPMERLEQFNNFSSPMARRLAGLLAACPEVNLPVVRMVQAAMLPESQQMHVAEVLLGGLFKTQKTLTTQTPADEVQYVFHEGVQPLVQDTVPPDYVFKTLSAWLNYRFGYSLEDFCAYVTPKSMDQIKPFASVMLGILKRRGTQYAELVQAIERQYPKLKTILLVEDYQKVIEKIREVFSSQYGIAVRGTDEVNEVIKLTESRQIDLILINHWLPNSRYQGKGVDGLEIIRILRANPNISSTLPIVGFSRSYRVDANDFLDSGADGFYSKNEVFSYSKNEVLLLRNKDRDFVDYLRKIFNRVKLTELLPYESAEDLDSVLDFIGRRHLEGRDTSEEDVSELFHKPKGDDGTFYLLENLCLLYVLIMNVSGTGPGTVRYALSPSYLNQNSPRLYPSPDGDEFNERLQQLYTGQRDLLDLIRQRNERQQDTSLADAPPLFFTHPEGGDIATYRRLEHLRLLGFITITDVGTSKETIRYNLSLKYQKYLATPFKGLMPYSEKDAAFLFGRERERDMIINNLMFSRLTILYGASGVGKSSFLRAGVAYYLRQVAMQNLEERGTPEFAIVVFNSWYDNNSIVGLMQQIEADIKSMLPDIQSPAPELSFVETLQAWTEILGTEEVRGRLFIVLDQFEEYFLYHPQEDGAETFAVEFPRAVNNPELSVNFLISIREDALAKLDLFRGRIPNILDNRLSIQPLDLDSARDVIVKLIGECNRLLETSISIEPELVEAVLEQVKDNEGRIETPYLQLIMSRLWDAEMKAGSNYMRLETLNELGGERGIVEQYLDRAMNSLSKQGQETAAQIFKYLVTPSGTKIAHSVSDLAEYTELDQTELRSLLHRLSSHSLRLVRSLSEDRYEIFHDLLTSSVLNWRRQYLLGQDNDDNLQPLEVVIAKITFDEEPETPQQLQFETVTVNSSGQEIKTETHQAVYYEEPLGDNISPVVMMAIPEGEFFIGSPEDERQRYDREYPQHIVKVAPFWLAQTPITNAQWNFVVSLPQIQRKLNSKDSNSEDDHPVTGVSWYDAMEFCARLSRHTGRDYRLPSEAEWEYACRAGTTTPFHFGATITSNLANYRGTETYADEPPGEYREKTIPVKSFSPNAFGLYDMHGQVYEWCADPWHDNYQNARVDGQVWDERYENDNYYQNIPEHLAELLKDDRSRVLRGGSWSVNPRDCRSAYRFRFFPDDPNVSNGFRVACGGARTQ